MSAVLVQTIGLMRRVKGPSMVGALYNGGYYAGIIVIGGIRYLLLTAPKNYYDSSQISAASNNFQNAPTAWTTNTNDGATTTTAMISAGIWGSVANYANTARTSGINSKFDWYVPARDELEVCYRNLKPTTNVNDTNGGANSYSEPTRGNYTASNPAQTTATLFQSGGAQAFVSTSEYHNCTFYSGIKYFNGRQSFYNGAQNFGNAYDAGAYMRLVRKDPA